MGENTIRIIQAFTHKVNALCMDRSNLKQKKHEPMIVDPHISTNMPATYLDVYPKLAEALPTIEDNFFCLPLTDKERKEAIFSYPKISKMKYLTPVVNETASTTAKRADSVLYNLQATLANITKPIDLFVHQKLLKNPEISNEDNLTVFVIPLGEMNLAGKPPHISEPETEPLFEPEAFNALVTAKNATRRADLRRRNKIKSLPQLRRQTARLQTINKFFAGRVAAEQNGIKVIQDSDQESESGEANGFNEKNFISSREINQLWSSIYNASASVQANASPRSKQSADREIICSISKESNREDKNTNPWILQPTPTYFHQNFALVIGIGKVTEFKNLCIFGQYSYYREDKREMCGIHIKGAEKTKRAGISDKLKERLTPKSVKTYNSRKDILMWISKLYKKSAGNANSSSPRPLNAEAFLRAKKQSSRKVEHMGINGSHRGFNAYKFQKAINYNIRTSTLECCRPLCALKIFGNLLINKYLTTSNLRTVKFKSSGCSKQANCTNGMFNIRINIHTVKHIVRRSQYRSICISVQHKNPMYYSLSLDSKSVGQNALAHNQKFNQKGTPRDNNTFNHNPVLENFNMVPRSTGAVNSITTAFTIITVIPDPRSGNLRLSTYDSKNSMFIPISIRYYSSKIKDTNLLGIDKFEQNIPKSKFELLKKSSASIRLVVPNLYKNSQQKLKDISVRWKLKTEAEKLEYMKKYKLIREQFTTDYINNSACAMSIKDFKKSNPPGVPTESNVFIIYAVAKWKQLPESEKYIYRDKYRDTLQLYQEAYRNEYNLK
ncbi:hypothetical protein BB561_005727 [Smittium simulii]|uniref:Uncharacterized protein n=1 Tax=Smittium simulii TaxID=133385 RepID=A0A2T9Y8T3_9FUNG|nr:hypothetical protein BB561_005727 [Smittium simulii]